MSGTRVVTRFKEATLLSSLSRVSSINSTSTLRLSSPPTLTPDTPVL